MGSDTGMDLDLVSPMSRDGHGFQTATDRGCTARLRESSGEYELKESSKDETGPFPSTQSFQFHLPPIHFTTYTNPSNTGTSINGPTVDAKAWSLSGPKVATATAIASSKLLLAAVKL